MRVHFRHVARFDWRHAQARCGQSIDYDIWHRTTRRWAKVTCKRCEANRAKGEDVDRG